MSLLDETEKECPRCGWDFKIDKESNKLSCPNCDFAIYMDEYKNKYDTS